MFSSTPKTHIYIRIRLAPTKSDPFFMPSTRPGALIINNRRLEYETGW